MGVLGFGLKWNMGGCTHAGVNLSRIRSIANTITVTDFLSDLLFTDKLRAAPSARTRVLYGRASLIGKMPGDDWQIFANLRALFRLHVGRIRANCCFMGG